MLIGNFSSSVYEWNAKVAAIAKKIEQLQVKIGGFFPAWHWNLTDDLEKQQASLLCCFKLCASFRSHRLLQTGVTVWKQEICVKISDFFPAWPWNLMYDLKQKRAPLLCYFKLCASFRSHRSIQIGVRVRKRQLWFLVPWNLMDDLESNRTPLPCHIKRLCIISLSYVNSVRKPLSWVLTSVTLTFDLWP